PDPGRSGAAESGDSQPEATDPSTAPGEAEGRALMEWFAEQVLPYQKIREVHFVDALPTSTAGKVLKTELRARSGRGPAAPRSFRIRRTSLASCGPPTRRLLLWTLHAHQSTRSPREPRSSTSGTTTSGPRATSRAPCTSRWRTCRPATARSRS